LLGGLVAGRQTNLAQESALMPGSIRTFLELQRAPQSVGCLGQPAGRLLDLGDVVQRLRGVDSLAGNGQRLGLPQERAFVVRSPGNGGRVLDESLFEMAQSEQDPTETRVRQRTRRGDRGRGSVCLEGLFQSAPKHRYVANSQRFLVALV
jgi:hypothetical protein